MKKVKKRRKLQNKVVRSFSLLALVLIIIITFVVADQYIRKEMGNGQRTAYSYTKAAVELIDGDAIAGYLETGEKDEHYYEIHNFMNAFQSNGEVRHYYVYVPYEDCLVYIWDATLLEGGACELGDREEYVEGGKETAFSVFKQDPAEEFTLSRDDKYGYLASAHTPVFDSEGNPVAIVAAAMYMPDIQANMREFLNVIIVAIVLLISIAILLCYNYVKKRIVTPIKTISNVSKGIVENLENEEAIEATVNTRDEIEELLDSFKQMYSDVKDYIKKLNSVTAEKERIGAELDVARHIQASMLPCIFPAFPDRSEIDIYATMAPAKEVGGDFYDFFMVDDRHLAVVMADVSGKGVPAALFMVIGKTLIKDHTTPGRDLGQVFTEVNKLLCESNSEEMFITAFEGVLDLVTGEFVYVNAGHEMPYICKAGGDFELKKIRAGFVLAGMEDMKYRAGSMTFEPGDKIFCYTDGVSEATDENNQLYGQLRLSEILNKVKSCSPNEILPAVKQNIDEFVGEAPQFDDITMLCLEYKSRMEEQ